MTVVIATKYVITCKFMTKRFRVTVAQGQLLWNLNGVLYHPVTFGKSALKLVYTQRINSPEAKAYGYSEVMPPIDWNHGVNG